MSRYIIILLGVVMTIPGMLKAWVVKEPVINVYVEPKDDTEVNTQAIYGSFVELSEKSNGMAKIKMIDGEEGWVREDGITENAAFEKSENLRPIRSLFANIYRVNDTSPYPPVMSLPYGCKVKLMQPIDKGERWIEIELASGEKAWIQRGDVDFNPKTKSLEEVLAFSKKFLGIPYTWGGTSTYGMDCSGYMQMLFKEMGMQLPRNSRNQANSEYLIPIERKDLQIGDIIFFGEGKITHVAMYLGNDEFIHCGVRDLTPMVMVSNLNRTNYTYYAARRIKK